MAVLLLGRSGRFHLIQLRPCRLLFKRSRIVSVLFLCTVVFIFLMVVLQDNRSRRVYYKGSSSVGNTARPSGDEPEINATNTHKRNPTKATNRTASQKGKKGLIAPFPCPKQRVGTDPGRNETAEDAIIGKGDNDSSSEEGPGLKDSGSRWRSYEEALAECAENGTRRLIILSLVDEGFVEMAFNFYDTSLRPNGLKPVLFIGLTLKTCRILNAHGLPCYVYRETEGGQEASLYNSRVFIMKMNIRTDLVLDGLELGYTVLHTDLDLMYFDDPLKYIPCAGGCDLAALIDKDDFNAGFIFVRPTGNSIWIYRRMQQLAAARPLLDDQDQLTQAIGELEYGCADFRAMRLDAGQFQNGLRYFELSDRTFDGDDIAPCGDCVVVHNNWIVSVEAKVYRFKEMQLWFYDGAQRYYSDDRRRYLAYSNPLRLEAAADTERIEYRALVNALTICQLLNRTLILPKFHCDRDGHATPCGLNSKYNVASFDREFGGKYREHTFLDHPLVPDRVKSRPGRVYLIASNVTEKYMPRLGGGGGGVITVLRPRDAGRGTTSGEILQWFIMKREPVLRFHSLYGAISALDGAAIWEGLAARLRNGLRESKYRQLS